MKKLTTLIAAIATSLVITLTAYAEDKIIDLPISKIISKIDKNNNDFKIIIVKIPRVLNGIRYTSSMTIMAFSDTIDLVEGLNEGENLKAIISENNYKGRQSGILLAIIE